ncbi:MAG: DUF5067 domain-containing protein [Clostridiales bacterium]|nr:DUF5067 domain-containing protein [Clostridiales bacterium]MBR6488369.1 DUF5067 domain-containing protein [Clostridiales bacterium]
MLLLIAFGPSVIAAVIAVVLAVVLRKKDPAKLAVAFSVIAFVCGLLHLISEFYPFKYSGPGGIDYIGDAIVWGLMVSSVLYGTIVAYISFALVATIYAIKTIRSGEKRKKGVISLVLSWICGIVIAGLIITNIVTDITFKKSISVEVTKVTAAVDSDGDPAVVILYELNNGSKKEITFLSAIYENVTQNDKELRYGIVEGPERLKDSDIKKVAPGSTAVVRKTYKLKDPAAPVKIVLRTYKGDVTYLDGEYTPK